MLDVPRRKRLNYLPSVMIDGITLYVYTLYHLHNSTHIMQQMKACLVVKHCIIMIIENMEMCCYMHISNENVTVLNRCTPLIYRLVEQRVNIVLHDWEKVVSPGAFLVSRHVHIDMVTSGQRKSRICRCLMLQMLYASCNDTKHESMYCHVA